MLISLLQLVSTKPTGYWAPVAMASGVKCRLYFDGCGDRYELWEVKFLAYLSTMKLSDTVEEPAKRAAVFAELVQLLDDRSLSLIIREAKNDGVAALAILREYYIGSSKPRIISLYTELTLSLIHI